MNKETAIEQLNQRIETVRRANIASFGETFRMLRRFLANHPVFEPILTETIEGYPQAWEFYRSYIGNPQQDNLSDLSEAQLAAVALQGLADLKDVVRIRDWQTRYFRLSGNSPEAHRQKEFDEATLQLAKDFLLEPLHHYLLDKLEATEDLDSESVPDGFSIQEQQEIARTLDVLSTELRKILRESNDQNTAQIERIERIVKKEFEDLKKDAGLLARKDWKNHFVAVMINLVMLFTFSSEARKTLQFSYELLVNIIYSETVLPDQVPPITDTFLLGETEDD